MSLSGQPLAEVEPRTAANGANTSGDASAGFVIVQPGPYDPTGNTSAPNNTTDVRIAASRAIMASGVRTLEGLSSSR